MKGKQYNYWTNMSCNNHSATTIYFGRQASLVKWIECTLLILIDILGSNPTADAKRVPLMLGLTLTSDILKDRGWVIEKQPVNSDHLPVGLMICGDGMVCENSSGLLEG